MKIGNRATLDAERNALRDQFDAVWLSSDTIGPKEKRAIRCAIALDKPNHEHGRGNWTIFPGGRACGLNTVLYG